MSEHETLSAEQMKQVLDVSRSLAATADLDTLLKLIAVSATSLLGAERASIFLHDVRTRHLWTRIALGAGEIRVPDTAGIVGHVFQDNRLLKVCRPYEDSRFNPEVDRRTGYITRNLLTAPTRDMDGRPNGVVQVINHIGGDFTDHDQIMIEMLADQAGVAIQRHYLHEQAMQAASLRHEMELARKIQVAMIPISAPQIPGLDAAGWTQPASVTGGDSYDLWEMPDGRLGIFVGDASGHGIGPAIVISQARTLARALAELECDPTLVLTRMNARLAQDLKPGLFATVFIGCMSAAGELHWSSAGHGPLLLRTGPGEKFQLLNAQAPPIGVVPELLAEPTVAATLAPGGMLVVLSDGVFEARNPSGQMLDMGRVLATLDQTAGQSSQQMLSALRQTVLQWQQREEPADDQTVVIVQRTR